MDDIGLHSHIGSATSAPAILSSSAAAASTTTTSTTASAYSVSDWYQEQEIHVEGELHDAFDHVAPSSPSDERPPPPPSAARSSSSRSSLGDISATGGGGGAAAATTSSETAKQHELAEAELDGRGAALNEAHAGGCCSLTMAVIVVFFAIYLVLLGLVGWSLLLPLTVVYAAAFLPASAWWTAMCFGRRAALRASVPPTMVFEIYVSAFVLAMPLVLLQWVVATVCFSSLELALDEFVAPEELRTMLLSPAQQQQQLLIVWLTVAIYTPLYAVLVRALPQVLLVLLLLRRLYTNREPLNTRYVPRRAQPSRRSIAGSHQHALSLPHRVCVRDAQPWRRGAGRERDIGHRDVLSGVRRRPRVLVRRRDRRRHRARDPPRHLGARERHGRLLGRSVLCTALPAPRPAQARRRRVARRSAGARHAVRAADLGRPHALLSRHARSADTGCRRRRCGARGAHRHAADARGCVALVRRLGQL